MICINNVWYQEFYSRSTVQDFSSDKIVMLPLLFNQRIKALYLADYLRLSERELLVKSVFSKGNSNVQSSSPLYALKQKSIWDNTWYVYDLLAIKEE